MFDRHIVKEELSLKKLNVHLISLIETQLWLKVLVGLILGILVGFVLGPSVGILDKSTSSTIVSWLALPGTIFLALIQMIVIPLVFASVVRGIAASDSSKDLKKIGIGSSAFFLLSTAIAVIVGLALAYIIKPGKYLKKDIIENVDIIQKSPIDPTANVINFSEIPQTLTSLLPSNPLASIVGGEMLQIVFFAILIGIALVSLDKTKSAPLFELLGSIQELCMKIVSWSMKLAPYAVFGLIARLTSTVGFEVLKVLLVYVITVTLGLLLMIIFYTILVLIIMKIKPTKFLSSIREVSLLALSTSSSAAVMPLSIKTAEEKFNVKQSITKFVIPLGATVNMNGTALYQAVATIFLAQVFDVNIGAFGLLFVIITAITASIGSPATPGTGIVILSIILEGVGIPVAGIALIIGVDRILDMFRTAVNVISDITACIILDKFFVMEK